MINTQELAIALSNSKVQYNAATIARRIVLTKTTSQGTSQELYARGQRNAKLYMAFDYIKPESFNWDKTGVAIRLSKVAQAYNKNITVDSNGIVKVTRKTTGRKLVHTVAYVYEELIENIAIATYEDVQTAILAIVK